MGIRKKKGINRIAICCTLCAQLLLMDLKVQVCDAIKDATSVAAA